MRAFLLVAAALVLAGCAAPSLQTASVDTPELVPGAFTAVVAVIDPAGGTGEPSFGVAPDGTLYANGNGGQGGGVYRSTDGGATWEVIATPVEPMPNFDPDLAVDKDGTIWFSALWIGCTSVASSRDGGASWVFMPAACNAPVSDRQYVIPTEGGKAFLYSHQLPTLWQLAAKTTDYGQTWIPTGLVEPVTNTLLTTSSGWGGGGFWNEVTGSTFFTWSWSDASAPGGWSPGFGVTRDDGASFEVGMVPGMGGDRLGLSLVVGAADKAGNVYLAWGETVGDGTGIFFASSTDDGKTWSEPTRVDDATPGSRVFPAITAGAAGKVAIAYYESADEAFPDDVEGAWNVTLAWTGDALAASPVFEHGTLSAKPVKEGGICISGTSCTGDREFADYFQVHVLPDGRVGAIFNSLTESKDITVEVFATTTDALLG